MPLTKTADRYRGRARSKQKTIDRMRTPQTPPAAGEWPEYPADALATWCAETLIVPPGHPLAGQPMVMPWYIRDFLADALASGITEVLISTARKNSKTAGIAMLVNGILAGPLRKPGTRIGAVSLTREKSGELLGQCKAIAEASDLQGVEFMRTPSPGMIRTLVLQRRFKEGCAGMREGRRAAWHGSVWPVRCILGFAPATAATHPARTVPGAASLAPPGRPAVS